MLTMRCAAAAVLLSAAAALPTAAQSTHPTQSFATARKTILINVSGQSVGNVTPVAINSSDTVIGSVLNDRTLLYSGFKWSNGNSSMYNYPGSLGTSLNGINDARGMCFVEGAWPKLSNWNQTLRISKA